MSQEVVTRTYDDLDPSLDADETMVFGLDGTVYEVDLTAANAARVREMLSPLVQVARVVKKAPRKRSRKSPTKDA